MSPETHSFRRRLSQEEILTAPGVYDALTALLAQEAGFDALYVSGAGLAYSKLGRPDVGLVSMQEVVDHVALIRDRVEAHLLVDADTGYGNALNVQRTVRLLERAGANAIQLEDQGFPKRCGHLTGKTLISAQEMVGKVKAAVDARASEETLIVARTDAIAVEGLEQAIERAAAYAEAGADVLFVEAPREVGDMRTIVSALGDRPLLANMVEGGHTPLLGVKDLEAIGFSIVIFPGGIARILAKTAQAFYRALAEDGSTERYRDRMFDFRELNEVIGTPSMLDMARAYAAE